MTFVAREIPPGSGRWTTVAEPNRPHPREAPQFECSMCSRVVGKKRTLVLLTDGRVICPGCLSRNGSKIYGRGLIDCFSTRAALGIRLGIWPGKPDAAKSTFRQWLKQFTADDGQIGEFARDVHRDRGWPTGSGSLVKFENYLQERYEDMPPFREAHDRQLSALRNAWAKYERERSTS
jgi:hypothetical protein